MLIKGEPGYGPGRVEPGYISRQLIPTSRMQSVSLFLGSWSEFPNKCVPHLDLRSLLPGGIWPRNGTNTRF